MEITVLDEWDEARFWRPLIGLYMRVAHADGRLVREEVRAVRRIVEDGLGLASDQRDKLRHLMKEAPLDLDELLMGLVARNLVFDPADVLGAMIEVAKSDGRIDATEIAVIREVALALGMSEAVFAATELVDSDAERSRHLQALGLKRGASKVEIRKAYRSRVRDYHPDRVAGLPDEFQALAHDKMVALRGAYDALMA